MEIMKKLMGFQSNLFIIMTSLALALGLVFDLNTNLYGLLMILVFVVLLGVPHGSLDVLFASQTYELKNISLWLKFITYYLAAALAVILVWLLVPNAFFIVFLILSALHFSDDLNLSDFAVLKLSYGTAIISFPSLFFSRELINLYAMIIETNTATKIVKASQFISMPAGIFIAFYLVNQKIDVRTKLELLCTCALFLMLNPILAFGVYFCLMHSARHLIRSRFFLRQFTSQAFLNALIFPTIAVILMGLIIWCIGPKKPLEVDLIRIIFVGLAALTVPHAWVLKQSNFQTHSKRY
jgi:Brp/Blh family beta-carotene 15,15'-monooxygenase